MSEKFPTIWRDSFQQMRDGVRDVFDRWLPQPLRRERVEDTWLSPRAWFGQGLPAVDVVEDSESVRVTAELPGMDEKDFSVEVLKDRLMLRGEKKALREEKREGYYCAECSYGSFALTIDLPAEVDPEKASAKYKNGVLTVTLPKVEGAKTRQVRVDVE